VPGQGPRVSNETRGFKLPSAGLAATSKPPVAKPTVAVAAAEDVAPDVPAAEGQKTPVTVLVLPVGSVGVGVSEGRVVDVRLGLGVGVGLETAKLVLSVQIIVADEATELEEADFSFFALTPGHTSDHPLVGALVATGGIQQLLGIAGAIDLDLADNHAADSVYALLGELQPLVSQGFTLSFQNLLVGVILDAALTESGSDEFLGLGNLPAGDGVGRGHGLGHGVVLLSSDK